MEATNQISNLSSNCKTLLIVRHAKSSWDAGVSNDFDRPLNDRGKRDAPVMASRLLNRQIKIDAFVSSPAKRAKETAELFCTQYSRPLKDILFVPKLYHAPAGVFYEAISELDNEFLTIALFSHNTGITEFVNSIIEEIKVDNMPTCAVFAFTSDALDWKDFNKSNKRFLFYDYPKHGS